MNATTARVPTTPENLKRIEDLGKKFGNLFISLAMRWLDESEYEDIAEYQQRIERELPEGFKIVKMTKRPFGFHFTIGTDAVYAYFCTTRAMGWKRVS